MIDLLDKRMLRILDVARAEAGAENGAGGSECFHLMEIKSIIEGRKTCGVYDNYGDPPTIKGPLFEAVAK